MASRLRDLTYAFRRILKSPGIAVAAIFSIGLGIAGNATIFSIVSTFILRPAPVGDPATLLSLHTQAQGESRPNHFTWPLYTDVRDQAKSFSGIAAYYELLPASMSGAGTAAGQGDSAEPERIWGQAATSNFFDVAQLSMPLGRGFLSSEEKQHVIVLGYSLWQRRFAADPAIIGKTITLSGLLFTVVGVAPRGFRGVDLVLDPEFWVPLGNVEQLAVNISDRNSRIFHWLGVIGRVKPGVSRAQVAAELGTLGANLAKSYPVTDKDNSISFDSAGSLPQIDKRVALLFLGALSIVVLLVLCIAGANVANLLLAQGAGRQREMAVRLALGATRGQLIYQVLTETVLLALAGGVLGVILALWATSALSAFHLPVPIPLDIAVSLDWRVLLYAFGLSIGAGIVFGLAPAWAAARPLIASALKGEDALVRPGRRFTLSNILVVVQISLSLVLLCVTGLFLHSLEHAAGMDVGFRSQGILMMSVDPRVHGYTPEHTVQFLSEMRDRAAALPGVTSVVVTDVAPLSMGNRSDAFHAEGFKSTGPDPSVDLYMVTPGYFETMGIPRILGRDFAHESATAPKVAVVNQVFVHDVFHDENPIGRRIEGPGVSYQVIGVVGNTKSRTLGEDLRPVLYRSLAQSVASDPSFLGYSLLIRTSDEAATASAVRNIVHSLDPSIAIFNTETMQEHLRDALFLPRLAGTLFGVFGFVGLTLASVGLYGVMSYSVSRRTREIGIRIALGAQLGAVQRLVVRRGMLLTAIALALGLPAAWMAAKFSSSFLYGIRPHDLATFTLVPVLLAFVALLACWIPARRAARVDPQTALRSE
jgi:predicted permease